MPDQPTPGAKRTRRTNEKLEHEDSQVPSIRDASITQEIITLELESDRPVYSVDNPDRIIPQYDIPKYIKDNIIAVYGEEFFKSKEWKFSVLKKLSKAITSPRNTLANALIQVCGPKCQNKDGCPHDILGIAPVSERCPVEAHMVKLLYDEYVQSVSERLGTEPDRLKEDIIPHNLIMGLVEADLISMRLDGTLAQDGFTTQVPTAVNEATGEVFYKDEESVPVRIKERVRRQRDQIYRQLLATPEMAEKYKKKASQDSLARTASLVDRLEKIISGIDKRSVVDAEIVEDNTDNTTNTDDAIDGHNTE